MKEYNVNRLMKMLDLKDEIVGIKFIPYKKEYDSLEKIRQFDKKATYCNMVRRAFDGSMFKAKKDNFYCDYSAYALGLKEPKTSVMSGRSYYASKLYETNAVSRKAVESMNYLHQDIYGVLIGPLKNMEEADVAILLVNAYQTMRIMQGYAYKYGMPQNLKSFGNQAMCSDLTSKPFFTNDINVSFLCAGARQYAKCGDGQLGVGMPIGLFDTLTEGVAMTLNPVEGRKEKEMLMQRLKKPAQEELGIEIDMDSDYGKFINEYDIYTEKMECADE